MRDQEKITYGIIFFITVLFCFDFNSSVYCNNPLKHVELSTNCVEDNFSSENDSFENDQIINVNEVSLFNDFVSRNHQDCFLISNHSLSIWQPPKISKI
jgi:hypothetical protein